MPQELRDPLVDGTGRARAKYGKMCGSLGIRLTPYGRRFKPTYLLGAQRSYDVWGSIRQGATSGDPKGQYCANLGHIKDDESGLTYMDARFYEPSSGRFLSQDSCCDGQNWYAYARDNPVGYR